MITNSYSNTKHKFVFIFLSGRSGYNTNALILNPLFIDANITSLLGGEIKVR